MATVSYIKAVRSGAFGRPVNFGSASFVPSQKTLDRLADQKIAGGSWSGHKNCGSCFTKISSNGSCSCE